jgi:hypothetical protein
LIVPDSNNSMIAILGANPSVFYVLHARNFSYALHASKKIINSFWMILNLQAASSRHLNQ